MIEEDKDEAFLGRWSRLKQQKAREEAKPAPAAEALPEPVTATPLPAIEDLKSDSDFKPFMDPQVDAGTRRSALKKLFTDAHFTTHDPFEPYSIDLTGEDPIPEEMLKTLNHARRMLFDEKEQTAQPLEQTTENPLPEPKDVAGKQDA